MVKTQSKTIVIKIDDYLKKEKAKKKPHFITIIMESTGVRPKRVSPKEQRQKKMT